MKELEKEIRNIIREFVTSLDLKDVDRFADSLFSDLGVDVEFTKHFLDRVNDPRNGKDIDPEELKLLYKKAHDKYGEKIANLKPGEERVFNDRETDINIPIAMNWDGKSPDIDMVAKTVMRKKNFLTSPDSPKMQLEMETNESKGLWDNIHAKRERGESPAKPGDKDYPKKDAWEKAQSSTKNENHDYVEDNEEEGEYYKIKLLNIVSMAEDINNLVDEDDDLPAWVQDKITIAEHNMDAILGYLISQNPNAFNDEDDNYDEEELDDEELDEACNYLQKLNKFNSKDGKFELYEVDEKHYANLNEAEYQGRKVKLGKIMRGDVKKFKVFVKKPNGKVVKVNFGDPNMRIKKSNPARRKSFRARHRCDNPGPRWKARYWACRTW